jgi:hypothetical protein
MTGSDYSNRQDLGSFAFAQSWFHMDKKHGIVRIDLSDQLVVVVAKPLL